MQSSFRIIIIINVVFFASTSLEYSRVDAVFSIYQGMGTYYVDLSQMRHLIRYACCNNAE